MDINVAKLEKGVVVAICIALVGYFGYLGYGMFFSGDKPEASPTLASVNPAIFGPKIGKAASSLVDPNQKIALKKTNLLFTESALYKSFQDLPIEVPLSSSRGRPDPFVPYVAP